PATASPSAASTNSKTVAPRSQMHMLSTATGHVLWNHPQVPRSSVFSRDGSRLCGQITNRVIIWNPATGEEIAEIPNVLQLTKAAWSPDGKRLALVTPPPTPSGFNPFVGNVASLVRIFDGETGKELFKLQGHGSQVLDIVF